MTPFKGTIDLYHASAGTGKTAALMDVIESYLDQGVPIERIAFVTFTRKGAQVAQERIANKFGLPMSRLKNIRTIHSMCFRGCGANREMMMDFNKYRDFAEQVGYNFGTLALDVTEGVDWDTYSDARLISAEQLYRTNPDFYYKVAEGRITSKELVQYTKLYSKYKQAFNYADFTDLLEQYLLKGCTEDVDIVCLDEMQDSSPLQWRVVFQAFAGAQHIYIASDVKQSIYTYSGADHNIVMNLRGTQHLLETSYRVPTNILAFANVIVDEISEKIPMHCVSKNEGGEVIGLTELREIVGYFNPNESWFFLARNKRFFKYYIEWCQENSLPYRVKDVPYFSSTDKLEFKEGRTDNWPRDKLEFAKQCYNAGTFYNGPDINISTIHSVKGDEADNVVILSDISKAVATQLDIDEDSEHRVFYVGVTRARKRLFIVYPQSKLYYPYIL